jgi:predicted ester cyclase
MSTQENKALADRFVNEVINPGALDRAGEFFTPDYIDHAAAPGIPPGIEGLKMFFGMFRAAFPDLTYKIEDTLAEGDHVVQRLTGNATMKGSFLGMPATGKHAAWGEIHIVRVGAGGKFVEHWANVDQISMFMQLGLVPAPGG